MKLEAIFTKVIETTRSNWKQEHTLTPEERDTLIREKLERAAEFHKAIRQREALFEESR